MTLQDASPRPRSASTTKQDRSLRLDQLTHAIALRFGESGALWELYVPDTHVTLDSVRLTIREFGSVRGAEASVLVPWSTYEEARDWLRCLPDGYPRQADAEPALIALREVFAPLAAALCFSHAT